MIVLQIGMQTASPLAYAKPLGYAPPVTEVARAIPGLSWEQSSKSYVGWPDAVVAFAEALAKAQPLPLAAVVGEINTEDRAEKPSYLPQQIRQYQVEGVRFLRQLAPNGGALLADDPGNGKTIQALVAARSLIETDGLMPVCVVVCPAYIKPVWAAEAQKWTDGFFEVRVLEGTKADYYARGKRPLLFVLNYDIAHAWIAVLRVQQPGVLICDEAHALMNERSRRSTAVKEIAAAAQARILLTGTPMTARPRDLWNPLDTLCPNRWGKGPWKFLFRHCAAHKETVAKHTTVWITDGSSNIPELTLRLQYVMLRRTKADVMKELPAITRSIIPVKVPSKNIMPIWKEGWGKTRRDTLSRALSLSGAGKIKEATELVLARVAEGQSCIVFTHLRETAKRLGAAIGKGKEGVKGQRLIVVTGEDSTTARTEAIKTLRELSKTGPVVIVATIDSIGMGVDLSFASVVVFVDLDWIPAKLIQAESRAHRSGQQNAVTIYYLIGVGTADEYVQKKVIERLGLYEQIVGGQEAGELREDLQGEQMSEDDVLADLRKMIEAGEVLSDEMEAA